MRKKFQFPTGWNSTQQALIKTSRKERVSIPNGMEFYNPLVHIKKMQHSFNSQRDGILRVQINLSEIIKIVSIPNGMEFYLSAVIEFIHLRMFQFPTGWNSTGYSAGGKGSENRFNSQRDGILRASKSIWVKSSRLFQFPTGWNSTLTNKKIFIIYTVSIPNGMEFYFFRQRGERVIWMFQFPTGWNSTIS